MKVMAIDSSGITASVAVVYTVRTDAIRIISARKATRKERKLYVGTLLS